MKNHALAGLLSLAVFFGMVATANAATPPAVSTVSSSTITTTSATLTGNLTSLGGTPSVTEGFQWGTTLAYGSSTSTIVTATGGFTSNITGLACNTLYHFHAYATNSAGTAYGFDMTFTTSPCTLSSVSTNPATAITATGATFNGTLSSTGGATSVLVGFNYGPTITYGTTIPVAGSMTTPGTFTATPAVMFACNTLYHYRAYATNSLGTAYGADTTFTTSPCAPTVPVVVTTGTTLITGSTATLNGNLTSLGGATIATVGFNYGTSVAYGLTFTLASSAAATGPFNGNISGLACGTTYHYRAWATNSAGTAYGADMTFTTSPCPISSPTVVTNAATAIVADSAQFNGHLTSYGGALSLTVGFQWGTTIAYGTSSTTIYSIAPGPFTWYPGTGALACNTLYHFRAYATNTAGTAYGADMTFTTSSCLTVVTVSATPITATAAVLNGNVTSLGGAPSVTIGFNYGTTTSYGTTVAPSYSVYAIGSFTQIASGLSCATTYHFRAWATNSAGTAYGADMTFTTSPCPVVLPTVVTVSATAITATSVVLNGNLTSLGGAATVAAGFGLSPVSFGISAIIETAPGPFNTVSLTGLSCATTYTFHAMASNSAGTAYGADMTFTTDPCLPTVVTVSATSLTTTSVVLNGDLTSLGGALSVIPGFQYWTPTSITVPLSSVSVTGPFSMPLSGLVCNTFYSYRAYATSSGGTTYGATLAFTTLPCTPPTVITVSATSLTTTSAVLNGDLTSLGSAATVSVGFELGLTTSYSMYGGTYTLSTTGPFHSLTISSLSCNMLYHYHAYAINSAGTAYGADMTFTTLPCPIVLPTVVTVSATAITATSVVLNGNLTSTGGAATTSVGFEYGTSVSYGSTATLPTAATSVGTFSLGVTSLSCGTLYHYRATATNSTGTATGADQTFTTDACITPPTVTTAAASSIAMTSAALNDNITSFGGATSVTSGFDYGTTIAYGSSSGVMTIPSSVGIPNSNGLPVTGLVCGTTYHYRAWAANSAGTGYGTDMLFTTLPCPTFPPSVATVSSTAITTTSAYLTGNLISLGGVSTAAVGFQYGLFSGGPLTLTPTTITSTLGTFTATITGLSCGTNYVFQAVATNGVGSNMGGSLSFTTLSCTPPTVITVSSGSITTTSATLNGNLTSLGSDTSAVVGFNYGTTTAYGSTAASSPVTALGSFSANATGLSCNTLYHFQAYGTNVAGTGTGADMTFTTSPCPITLPVVSTTAATAISGSSADMNGYLSSIGGASSFYIGFNYGTTTSYGTMITVASAGLPVPTPFTYGAGALACNTLYHYRAWASNTVGTAFGADQTFTTLPCTPPTVVTVSSTSVTATGATLVGSLTSFGWYLSATTGFEYGTTPAYGSTATITPPTISTGGFTLAVSGLACNTTYHFRATASNPVGTGTGTDMSFTTSSCPIVLPTVITTAATSIVAGGAILNGSLLSLGGAASITPGFQWGTTTAYASGSLAALVTLTSPGTFSLSLPSGLSCNTLYHYRAYAANAAGNAYGADLTFTTLSCPLVPPAVTTISFASVTTTSVVVNGSLTSLGSAATASVGFGYGPSSAGVVSIIVAATLAAPGAFTATITGLTCATPYVFNANATSSGGVAVGAVFSFTTSPCPVVLPIVITTTAGGITPTSATWNGNLTSLGGAASITPGFQWGTTTAYLSGSLAITSTLTSPGYFGLNATGLACGTLYHYRAYATNSAGTTYGADMTAVTSTCPILPPIVITTAGTAITTNSAMLNGTISSIGTGAGLTYGFNWGTTTAYGSTISGLPTGITTAPSSFYRGLTGFACSTTYHYRAWATTSVATAYGFDMTFTTSSCTLPVVTTNTATAVGSTTATMNGTLSSLGGSLSLVPGFRWGLTTAYAYGPVPSGITLSAAGNFSRAFTGLTCGTTYHYQAYAANSAGTAFGGDKTFTTSCLSPF